MNSESFGLLRSCLDLRSAILWLATDAVDDQFPDPIRYRDITSAAEGYLKNREHRLFQYHAHPYYTFHAPKPRYFLREIVHLPVLQRMLYLAILKHLLPKLDPKLPQEVYSYRLDADDTPNAYPFSRRPERWKDFENDFRRACLDDKTAAVLITDIASYYEHISVARLVEGIESLLGAGASQEDLACLMFLKELLLSWTQDGFGVPVNYDPSSFLCSVYLTPVDIEMTRERRYRYFRWVDDIRVVAQSKGQAIRALHDLQASLRRHGLYLSTAKTKIIEKGTPAFENRVDVSDDVQISEFEEALASRDLQRIGASVSGALARLDFHCGENGDDRKFRAYANRLANAAEYNELRSVIWPRLKKLVLPRLASHPEKSDTWVNLLSADVDEEVQNAAFDFLSTSGKNMFEWQRMWLWELLIRCEGTVQERSLAKAREVRDGTLCDAVSARAVVLLGKCGDNILRNQLFDELCVSQRSVLMHRAVLLAVQELPDAQRELLFQRALRVTPESAELVSFLQGSPAIYTLYRRHVRCASPEKRGVVVQAKRGIGKVSGKVVHYRLNLRDYDYE